MVNKKLGLSEEERRVRKNEQNKKSRVKVRKSNKLIEKEKKNEWMKLYRKRNPEYRMRENQRRLRSYMSVAKREAKRAAAEFKGAVLARRVCGITRG